MAAAVRKFPPSQKEERKRQRGLSFLNWLSRFPSLVDLHRLRKEAPKLVGPQSLRSLVYYVVKDNQLYRRPLGPLPGFQYFSDAVLSYLTAVVKLPA
ncbi:UNVERIFIED_CONTAM: hypothetical protein H355_014599 [Colinus virginianus]|nr:hypothetical protein H355_014599 [Colinus virginianus]